MAEAGEIERLIISDQAGNYYLLTRDMIERARVEGDQKREIEQLVHSADVTGFSSPAPALSFFGSTYQIHGACACSYAGCTTYTAVRR